MNYDVDFFIQKFQSIPDHMWIVGNFISVETGACCAQGHCGMRDENAIKIWWNTDVNTIPSNLIEALALTKLFESHFPYESAVGLINNGRRSEYKQLTPKARILAALHDIKKLQQPEYKDITKDLAILPQEETTDVQQHKLSFS